MHFLFLVVNISQLWVVTWSVKNSLMSAETPLPMNAPLLFASLDDAKANQSSRHKIITHDRVVGGGGAAWRRGRAYNSMASLLCLSVISTCPPLMIHLHKFHIEDHARYLPAGSPTKPSGAVSHQATLARLLMLIWRRQTSWSSCWRSRKTSQSEWPSVSRC